MGFLEIVAICAIPFFLMIAYLYYEQEKKRKRKLEERIRKLEGKTSSQEEG
jgi:hypothetical protein